jgi:hypothetical protein
MMHSETLTITHACLQASPLQSLSFAPPFTRILHLMAHTRCRSTWQRLTQYYQWLGNNRNPPSAGAEIGLGIIRQVPPP